MTSMNGNTNGTIFRTDSVGNNYEDVYTFNNSIDGINPYGSLMEASDGKLYGMTKNGGSNNFGTIFSMDPLTLDYTKIHDFDSINGKNPYGSLMQASNGKLYGMTYAGGGHNLGVLFELNINTGLFTKITDFDQTLVARPYGSLIEANDGMLYGLSSGGGGDATGCLFQYNYNTGAISHKYSFILGPSRSGYDIRGSLIQATDGKLYGLSRYGEPGFENGGGVIYSYDLATPVWWESFTSLYVFSDVMPGSQNGYDLKSSLVQADNGKLYGMTQLGGNFNAGTIFEYDIATDTVNKLYDINTSTDGYKPLGSLMQASNGKLYGLTTSDSGQAKMFEFDISTNTFTVNADVTGTPYYTTLLETGNVSLAAMDNNTVEALIIFPNPSTDYITIDFPNIIHKITVIDMTGKAIKIQYGNATVVNIADINTGIYHLKIETGNTIIYRKFSKL